MACSHAAQQLPEQRSDQRLVPSEACMLHGRRQVSAAELHYQHMRLVLLPSIPSMPHVYFPSPYTLIKVLHIGALHERLSSSCMCENMSCRDDLLETLLIAVIAFTSHPGSMAVDAPWG